MNVKPNLLVVDDHEAFLALTVLRLRALGCSVVGVSSVPDAIDALERERFDTVLSDHEMPGLSGIDLLAFAQMRRPDTPFVLMSGVVDDRLRTLALEGGAAAVFEKSDLFDSLDLALPALAAAA